ncbi:MAG: flagellar export chaperone FliS [Armatimonadota bacterium]|nr:flagellar export chaperone FliS [bacterium]
MPQDGYAQYQRNQLLTASPAKLLLAAYDGAIRFARIGQERMKEGNLEEQCKYINKTVAIVAELLNTLRDDLDPVLSGRLKSLYLYVINKLASANLQGDQAALAEAIKILSELREAWAGAEKILQQQAITEEAA